MKKYLNLNIEMGIDGINDTFKDVITAVTGIEFQKKTRGKNHQSHNDQPTQQYGFYQGIPLIQFSGKKVAFDISIIMHQKMSTAYNEVLMKSTSLTYDHRPVQEKAFRQIIGFFGNVLELGITPVVVFDGPTHESKKSTVNDRREKKNEKLNRTNALIQNYMSKNPLERTQAMFDEIKDSMKDSVRIKYEDYQALRNILTSMGIVCLTAPHDAEKLCASLSLEKIVDAVCGSDTDSYPLGSNVVISKIYHSGSNGLVCDVIYVEQIMYCMSIYCNWRDQNGQIIPFQHYNLVDLCILHGCDFNERMKFPAKNGKSLRSVGPKTALDYIQKYGYFERFPIELYEYMAPLQIGICRERFQYEPSGQTSESTNMNWRVFRENYRQIISDYSLETYMVMTFSRINPRNLHLGLSYEESDSSFDTKINQSRQYEIAHDSLSIPIFECVNSTDINDNGNNGKNGNNGNNGNSSFQGFRM